MSTCRLVEKATGQSPSATFAFVGLFAEPEDSFRRLTPAIRDRIYQLGIPGLEFVVESKRFYPSGKEAAHILGAVNIDNQGIADRLFISQETVKSHVRHILAKLEADTRTHAVAIALRDAIID